MGRMGKPREMASFGNYLVANEDSYLTGINYIIDG
jgi:hypothetical protein